MDTKRFNELAEKFFGNTAQILGTKSGEYANSEDKLANFKRTASLTGVNPETVAMIFMMKHIDSIGSFVKKLQQGKTVIELEMSLSEPIDGRLSDATNYLLFMAALVAERRDAERTK